MITHQLSDSSTQPGTMARVRGAAGITTLDEMGGAR
jgi:hypothetical protein